MRGSWCGHNPQSGGSFRWERRGSGIQGGGHIGRHGGGNFGTETQIRVQIDRGGNTHKKGFTKSETHRVTIVDKESICKNVWKQKITLSVTYLKANFYRRLRDRQEVEKGSELLWFGSTGDEGGSLRPWIRGRL